ncbi:response regulator transcription factor [Peribacillus kribbensis]|uniref:response regulator transcription factor n=1 Tax=Peribacillus kribbensis TaxID=356658 RepID=UPI0003F61F18|nr:response regulator transcription factor [Peribacillus kribbensis]
MKTILIVDDEPKIREVISSYLKREDYQIAEAQTGEDALSVIHNRFIDFIILDLMLPDMSGEEVCRRVRKVAATPILMLTAKVMEDDKIHGLSIGADDYMVKPFSPRELVMRVKTILRRTTPDLLLAESISFNNGALVINQSKQEVKADGNLLPLTPSEYKLLLVMAKYPERVYTRDELVDYVMGMDFDGDARIIDQHIKNLRHKMEANPKKPIYLVTVYGIGYKFSGERV